jgi:hypothetical protein
MASLKIGSVDVIPYSTPDYLPAGVLLAARGDTT